MKRILALSCLAIVASNAFAAVTLLTSRSQITEQAYIDWGVLGSSYNVVASPQTVTTSGDAFHVKVTNSSPNFERRDEGNGWLGVFAPGDHLLWTQSNGNESVTMQFAKTVADVGTQIQDDYFGSFTGKITAYNGLDQVLGSFTVNGVNDGSEANTAPFIGVHSDISDILKIKLEIDGTGHDFAVNRVSLAGCKAVPEPASLSALAFGVVGLVRRKLKKA